LKIAYREYQYLIICPTADERFGNLIVFFELGKSVEDENEKCNFVRLK